MSIPFYQNRNIKIIFADSESKFSGKEIALFGFSGWGDDEWMCNWEETCHDSGASLATESVTCTAAPDDDTEADCRAGLIKPQNTS